MCKPTSRLALMGERTRQHQQKVRAGCDVLLSLRPRAPYVGVYARALSSGGSISVPVGHASREYHVQEETGSVWS
ncbi:hypothetical protein NDU88_001032 [Pleurodeles waltl]|uniref:Uncharacterized protein n=1 Tax=Pleurodeles waltl TaxID=8319 RepID=A0AAV7P4K2_PLEWA|nr:hypothetical protein NDU88_001032 [Pleurodeles waltl]